jgi:hypothetical protein
MRGIYTLGDGYTLRIYAPDDGSEKGWTVRVEGTSDPKDASVGRSWEYGIEDKDLFSNIYRYLCKIVPSSLVEQNWKKTKSWLWQFFWGYNSVGPMSSPSD